MRYNFKKYCKDYQDIENYEAAKKKMSAQRKGMRFFNNGKINKRAKECPPGFIPGRLRK